MEGTTAKVPLFFEFSFLKKGKSRLELDYLPGCQVQTADNYFRRNSVRKLWRISETPFDGFVTKFLKG